MQVGITGRNCRYHLGAKCVRVCDGFTAAAAQLGMALFMDEGHFFSHLRRMRVVYGAKRAMLVEGLAPLAALGWAWPRNAAGMHLLVRHGRGDYVRAVAAASSLELALLSSYRVARTSGGSSFRQIQVSSDCFGG